MVACAALSSLQPLNPLAVPMAVSAQTVEDIKNRLSAAAENGDQSLCETLLNEVRPMVTSRVILEETRIGFIVNKLRKEFFKKWPTLSQISREVIKQWSDVVSDEVKRPHSGASSRNTTPNVLSPSVARLMQRGITPNTPAGRRVTSTGLQGSQGRLVSPANGSYAPRVSPGEPVHTNGMHKSATVSGDLLKLQVKPTTPKENGKRKAVDDATTPAIKRTKTAAGSLSVSVTPVPGTSTPSAQTPTSVLAARKAAQSTSELFAQMSQTLPQHIDIGTDIREHEEKVKREMKDEELAQHLQASASYGNMMTERKKRKYERKSLKASAVPSPMLQSSSPLTPSSSAANPTEGRLPSLVFRFGKNGLTSAASTPAVSSLASEENPSKRKYEKSLKSVPRPTTPPPTHRQEPEPQEESEEDEPEPPKPKPELSKLKDWKSLIPTMEELRIRAQEAEEETKKVVEVATGETKKDPTRVQLVTNFRRPILILPYLENPTGPDFLLHKYPNSLQYYSEDNFRFGEKRPTE